MVQNIKKNAANCAQRHKFLSIAIFFLQCTLINYKKKIKKLVVIYSYR